MITHSSNYFSAIHFILIIIGIIIMKAFILFYFLFQFILFYFILYGSCPLNFLLPHAAAILEDNGIRKMDANSSELNLSACAQR